MTGIDRFCPLIHRDRSGLIHRPAGRGTYSQKFFIMLYFFCVVRLRPDMHKYAAR